MRLEYAPSSQPLHISAKLLSLRREVCRAARVTSARREGEYVAAFDHGKVRGVLDALGVTLPDWPSDVRTPDRSVPFDTGPPPPLGIQPCVG